MAPINKRRERNRVSYDILNNLSSLDLFYNKNSKKKIVKENLRNLPGRALIARKEDADVSEKVPSLASVRWTTDRKMRKLHANLEVFCRAKACLLRGIRTHRTSQKMYRVV
jgi:hypothetical protein